MHTLYQRRKLRSSVFVPINSSNTGGSIVKITWFGGATFRIYIGGKIFVTDAERAGGGVDRHEVAAGADEKISLSDGMVEHPYLDVSEWRRTRARRPIDEPVETVAALFTISGEGLFIDEPQDGPLIVAPGGQTAWGHFADGAVAVLFGDPLGVEEGARSLLIAARPRLIALAAEGFSDAQFRALAKDCGDCALQVMEQGLALEA